MGPDLLPLTAYAELIALAERELELVRAGEHEQLAALDERRRALIATLPAVPPAEAAPLLERLARATAASAAAMELALGDIAIELGRVARGRDLRAYGGARALPRAVDRSA